jgi:hypothetical protein
MNTDLLSISKCVTPVIAKHKRTDDRRADLHDAILKYRHSRESGNPLAFDGRQMDPRFRGDDASFAQDVTLKAILTFAGMTRVLRRMSPLRQSSLQRMP